MTDRLTKKKEKGGGIPHEYWSVANKEALVQKLGPLEDAGIESGKIRYYVIRDGRIEASAATMDSAQALVEEYRQLDAKHYMLRPEYSIVCGVETFVK